MPVGLLALGLGSIIGVIAGGIEPVSRGMSQKINTIIPNNLFPAIEMIAMVKSGSMTFEKYLESMLKQGYDESQSRAIFTAAHSKYEPLELITLKRRGKITDSQFYEYMSWINYNKVEADDLLTATEFYPSPSDLVTWEAKEVYEQDAIDKFGLAEEFDKLDVSKFNVAGVSSEQALNYWIAHWEHPSWTQMQRFRHYTNAFPELGIDDDLVKEWFRLVEVPPFWRDAYVKTIYEPLTRIDIRRMWYLGLIDDSEVIRQHERLGYSPDDSANLAIYVKLDRLLPELRERFKNGWIKQEDVKSELISIGVPTNKIDVITERIVKADKPIRTQKEKDLTQSQILKGVKRGVIKRELALKLLQQIGYDSDEANLILRIEIDWTDSPETPLQHLEMTNTTALLLGLQVVAIPQEALQIEIEYFDVKNKLAESRKKKDLQNIATLEANLSMKRIVYTDTLNRLGLSEYISE